MLMKNLLITKNKMLVLAGQVIAMGSLGVAVFYAITLALQTKGLTAPLSGLTSGNKPRHMQELLLSGGIT
jgi:hypothetical protein